jgi:hypothetical protein
MLMVHAPFEYMFMNLIRQIRGYSTFFAYYSGKSAKIICSKIKNS